MRETLEWIEKTYSTSFPDDKKRCCSPYDRSSSNVWVHAYKRWKYRYYYMLGGESTWLRTYPLLLHVPRENPSGSMHMQLIEVEGLSSSYPWTQNWILTGSYELTTDDWFRRSNSITRFPQATNSWSIMRGLWQIDTILFWKYPSKVLTQLSVRRSHSLTVWSSLPEAAMLFQYVRQLTPSLCP